VGAIANNYSTAYNRLICWYAAASLLQQEEVSQMRPRCRVNDCADEAQAIKKNMTTKRLQAAR